MDYLRFDNKEDAQKTLDEINSNVKFPLVGVNARTKIPQPKKQQTTKWAEKVEDHLDGKFGFKEPVKKIADVLEIKKYKSDDNETKEEDKDKVDGLYEKNMAIVEEKKEDWYPKVDDKGDVIVKEVEEVKETKEVK